MVTSPIINNRPAKAHPKKTLSSENKSRSEWKKSCFSPNRIIQNDHRERAYFFRGHPLIHLHKSGFNTISTNACWPPQRFFFFIISPFYFSGLFQFSDAPTASAKGKRKIFFNIKLREKAPKMPCFSRIK